MPAFERKTQIGLVSSAFPPDLDGIGDYTWWMAKALAEQHDVRVFTRRGAAHPPIPRVEVVPFLDPAHSSSFKSLVAYVEEWSGRCDKPYWLVLQYNPFSWGRRGYCPWVPQTLRAIKHMPNAPRIAVMFHETYVPRWPWKYALMFLWQKPTFCQICRVADRIFVSTERWISQVQRAGGQPEACHLPVGSNIPLSSVSRDVMRQKLGIGSQDLVVGMFGGMHASKQVDWVAKSVRRLTTAYKGKRTLVLYVGNEGGALRNVLDGLEIMDAGHQQAEEVGGFMKAMDVMLTPFVDGVSTRRGSVMAALQHGVPLATTRRVWTDRIFLENACPSLLISDAEFADQFAGEVVLWVADLLSREVAARTAAVEAFHRQHFTWPDLARRMTGHLQKEAVVRRKIAVR